MEQKTNVEAAIQSDLYQYLTSIKRVDEHLPEAPDLEELWAKIGEAYLPDALREWNKYPTVSLGWIMYIGMAVARYWDTDWQLYSKVENLYTYLRDRIDFDHMDDYICQQVLLLQDEEHKQLVGIVAECASRTVSKLTHMGLQPGSEEAFRGFIAALHQMYLMGIAIEMKSLGYHMTKMG